MMAINLIPRRLREAAAVRARVRRWVVVGAVYSTGLAGACVVMRTWGGEQASRLDTDGGQLAARVASGEQTLDRLRKDVQENARRLEASETVGVHPDWSTFLAAVAELRRDAIIVQLVDVRATDADKAPAAKKPDEPKEGDKAKPRPRHVESYLVTLKGFGLSQTDVMGFVRRLENLGPLVDVQLKEARAQPFRTVPAVAFDAECRLVERPVKQAGVEAAP
jgi:hypothetical protein